MSLDDLEYLEVGEPWNRSARRDGTKPTPQGVVVKGFGFSVRSVEVRYVPEESSPADDYRYSLDGERAAHPRATQRMALLVIVVANVFDRETGQPTQLHFQQRYPERMGEPQAVRRMLHEMVCHEVDECLYVQGQRVYDPHRLEAEAAARRHRYDQNNPLDRF